MVFGQIKKPDFKDIKFPVKTTDIQKVEKKKNYISICFLCYENKVKYPIYVSKNVAKKNIFFYY